MKQDKLAESLARIEAKLDAQAIQPMSLPEAATYLHLSKSTVYSMTSRSQLAHFKAGKKLVFLKSDLDRYLLRNRVATREEIQALC